MIETYTDPPAEFSERITPERGTYTIRPGERMVALAEGARLARATPADRVAAYP